MASKLKFALIDLAFFELGISLMAGILEIYLGKWAVSIYLQEAD